MRVSPLLCPALLIGLLSVATAADLSPEAGKYLDLLKKRPQPGAVFDRFTEAWVKLGTMDELGAYLKAQAETAGATSADWMILALHHAAGGQDEDSLAAARRAQALDQDNPAIHLRIAELASRLKQWEETLAALELAGALTGEDEVRAVRLQAETLWRLERNEEAAGAWRTLLEKRPGDDGLREELVDALAQHGQRAEAVRECQALIEQTRDAVMRVQRRLLLAGLLEKLERHAEAIEQLELCLAQSGPDSWLEAESLDRMERVYKRHERREFTTRLEALAKEHPARVAVALRCMRLIRETRSATLAVTYGHALLARTPGRRDVREHFIAMLEDLGRLSEAVTQAEALHAQHPDDAPWLLRLADLQAKFNKQDQARASLEKFIKLSAGDPSAPMQAAQLCERHDLLRDAREILERWKLAQPEEPGAALALAAFLHRTDRKDEALAVWRSVLAKADAPLASQVVGVMSSRGEAVAAFEGLRAREAEFAGDVRVLTQLCQLAITTRNDRLAVPWLRQLAAQVQGEGDMERLLTLGSSILALADVRKVFFDIESAHPSSAPASSGLVALAHELSRQDPPSARVGGGTEQADAVLALALGTLQSDKTQPISRSEAILELTRLRLLRDRGDWMTFAHELQESLQRPGGKTSTRLQLLYESLIRSLDYEGALRVAQEWRAATPASFAPWRAQADALEALGRQNELLVTLQEAYQRFDGQEEALQRLSKSLESTGKISEALALHRRALDEEDLPSARLQRAGVMARLALAGNLQDALRDEWQERQRRDPRSAEPWRLLALHHFTMKNNEAYREALTEAVRLAPKDAQLLLELASAEERAGNLPLAQDLSDRALALDQSPTAKRSYALMLLHRGQSERAMALLLEAISAQAASADEFENAADALMLAGYWKEAALLLEGARAQNPDSVRLHYQLAVALEEHGSLARAEKEFCDLAATRTDWPGAVPLPEGMKDEPPGLALLDRVRDRGHRAYLHRSSEPRRSDPMLHGPVRFVALPQCAEEVQVFALRHLMRLGELRARGAVPAPEGGPPELRVPMPDLWRQFVAYERFGGRTCLLATTAQVRTHPALLAMWLERFSRFNIADLPASGAVSLCELARETFGTSQPELAARAALSQALQVSGEARAPLVASALEYAARAPHITGRVANLAAALALRLPAETMYKKVALDSTPLAPADENRLIEALMAWARQAAPSDTEAPEIISRAATALAHAGRWEEWARMLDEVLPKLRANAGANELTLREPMTSDLAFPSLGLPGEALAPLDLISGYNNLWNVAGRPPAPGPNKIEAREPVVRLLLLHAAGKMEELQQEAARLSAAEPARADLAYLHMSVTAMRYEPAATAAALRRWAELPVSSQEARRRAGFFVNLVTDEKIEPNEAVRKNVAEAVRHLASHKGLRGDSSGGIATSLRDAGYTAEALALPQTQPTRPVQPTSAQRPIGHYAYTRSDPRADLTKNPGDIIARAEVIVPLLVQNTDMAIAYYRAAPIEDRRKIGELLTATSPNRFIVPPQRLRPFIEALLREAAKDPFVPADLSWIEKAVDSYRVSQNGSAAELLHPATTFAPERNAPPNGFGDPGPDLVQEARDRYAAFCELAMKVPEFAEEAFASYAALKLHAGEPLRNLAPKAREVLETLARTERHDADLRFQGFVASDPSHLWQPPVLLVAALHAARQEDAEASFATVTDLAWKARLADGRQMQALQEICTCPEDQFLAAADRFRSPVAWAGWPLWRESSSDVVARVWQQRGLKVNPASVVLPRKNGLMLDRWLDGSDGVALTVHELAARGELDAAHALTQQAFEWNLGPRAQWKDFVTAYSKTPNYSDDSPWSRIREVANFAENSAPTHPALCLNFADLLAESGLLQNSETIQWPQVVPAWLGTESSAKRNSSEGVPTVNGVAEFLKASSWLKPDAPFWDVRLGKNHEGPTLLLLTGRVMNTMSRLQDQQVMQLVEGAAPHSASASILRAIAHNDPSLLQDALKRWDGTLADSPPHCRDALLFVVNQEMRGYGADHLLAVRQMAPQFFTASGETEKTLAIQRARAIEEAKRVEDTGLQDSEFEQRLAEAATGLAGPNPVRAAALLRHGCGLIADKQTRGRWNGHAYGSNGWNAPSEAMKRWCDDAKSLDIVTVACDVFHAPGERVIAHAGWWSNPSWGAALLEAWRKDGLERMLRHLHSRLSIPHAPLLITGFMDFHLKLPARERAGVFTEAEKLAAQPGDIAELASWVTLAFRLNDLANSAGGQAPGADDPAKVRGIMEAFHALIRDESVNPQVRLTLAHCLLRRAPKYADPALVRDAMELATKVLENGWTAHGYQMQSVLTALNKLPVEDGDRAVAGRWHAAWLRMNRPGGAPLCYGQNYAPVVEYQHAVLVMVARTLEDGRLRQTLQSFSPSLRRYGSTLMILVRHGRDEVARGLFQQQWKTMDRHSLAGYAREAGDRKLMEGFIKGMDAERALVARVCGEGANGVGALNGSWADGRAYAWSKRMEELAREFVAAPQPIIDPKVRETVLRALADSPHAATVLAPEIKELDLATLENEAGAARGKQEAWWCIHLPMELYYAEYVAAAGALSDAQLADPKANLHETLEPLAGMLHRLMSASDSTRRTQAWRHLVGNAFETTALRAPEWPSHRIGALLPLWQAIQQRGARMAFEDETGALGTAMLIAVAALSGQEDAQRAWRQSLLPQQEHELLSRLVAKRQLLLTAAQELCRLPSGKWRPFEDRQRLLQGLAKDPWGAACLSGLPDGKAQLIKNHLLTPEEAAAWPDLEGLFAKAPRAR